MAGYMTWYDESVQFDCGAGSGSMGWGELPDTAYADVLFTNLGDETVTVDWIINSAGGATDSNPSSLGVDRSQIVYNTAVFELDPTGFDFVVDPDDDNVFWAAVVYDPPASATRSPYTDPGGGEAFLKLAEK